MLVIGSLASGIGMHLEAIEMKLPLYICLIGKMASPAGGSFGKIVTACACVREREWRLHANNNNPSSPRRSRLTHETHHQSMAGRRL